MFIFMLGLVAAGIGLLWQRDKFREEIKNYYNQEAMRRNGRGSDFNNADGANGISPEHLARIENGYVDHTDIL
jgi:hypothetical protein